MQGQGAAGASAAGGRVAAVGSARAAGRLPGGDRGRYRGQGTTGAPATGGEWRRGPWAATGSARGTDRWGRAAASEA